MEKPFWKDSRKIFMTLVGLVFLMTAASLLIVWSQGSKGKFRPFQSARAKRTGPKSYGQVGSFELKEAGGELFRSKRFSGRVTLAYLFFTRCMGPCPMMSAQVQRLQSEFDSTSKLQFVAISVDPKYDTPEELLSYAERFKADRSRWFFLYGTYAEVEKTAIDNLKLATSEDANLHSTRLVLIDPSGEIRGWYDSLDNRDLQRLRRDILTLNVEFFS